MNWDYRRTARDYDFVIDKVAGDDLTRFPIEKARFRSIWYPVIISSACIVGYGWSLLARTVSQPFPLRIHDNNMESVAVPLVLQFLIGAMISVVFNVSKTPSQYSNYSC